MYTDELPELPEEKEGKEGKGDDTEGPIGWFELTNKVPSKSMSPYPEGSRIYTRPYNTKEIETTSELKYIIDGGSTDSSVITSSYTVMLAGVKIITPEGEIDSKELTLGDFFYVTLYRKVMSLSATEFVISVPGFLSEKVSVENLTFDEIEAEGSELEADFTSEDGSTVSIPMGMVRVGQFIDYIVKEEKTPDDFELSLLSIPEENREVIRKLTSHEEREQYREMYDSLYHGMKPVEVKMKSKEGGEEIKMVDLQDPTNLILPFRGTPKSRENKIRVRKARYGRSNRN